MKRFLISMCAAMCCAVPVYADPEVRFYSNDSLGCLMLRECTDGVDQIRSTSDAVDVMPGSDYSHNKEELNSLFAALGESNIDVFLADGTYFPPRHRGVYDVSSNSFFLNKDYVYDETHMIGVMRHEGWHAAQDCMAGTLDNTFTAVILQDGVVPQYYIDLVARTYPPAPRPWENEAFYAASQPNMPLKALEACASYKPMWESYEPTPMTREWLVNEGYIK